MYYCFNKPKDGGRDYSKVMRRITTFRSTTYHIYNGGPLRL